MSQNNESSRSDKSAYLHIFMMFVFILLLSFALWLVWVTYFREHYAAGIIEVRYANGTTIPDSASDSGAPFPRFHNEVAVSSDTQIRSACVVCHGEYPHTESKKVRAFLNAHAYIMTCEVCHLKVDDSIELTYRWLDEESDTVVETRSPNARSRIIPVQYTGGDIKRFDRSENLAAIRQYAKNQSQASAAFQKAMIKETHLSVPQDHTPCDACHNINGEPAKLYHDLTYPPDRVGELQRNEVAGMTRKYKAFYMPSLTNESVERK